MNKPLCEIIFFVTGVVLLIWAGVVWENIGLSFVLIGLGVLLLTLKSTDNTIEGVSE